MSKYSIDNKYINTIRLIYIYLEKFNRSYDGHAVIGETYGISSQFVIPKGMDIKKACKIISYLSEKVEKENDIEPASEESVILVNNLLEDYGFKKVESCHKGHHHVVAKYSPKGTIKITHCPELVACMDLFTVAGDFNLFKRTDLYDRYFEWFTEGVKESEIKELYTKKTR